MDILKITNRILLFVVNSRIKCRNKSVTAPGAAAQAPQVHLLVIPACKIKIITPRNRIEKKSRWAWGVLQSVTEDALGSATIS